MFTGYRATHEIDFAHLVPITAGVLTGEVDADSTRVRAALRRRSVRFHLDVDVASFLTPFAGTLASLYEDAKFVLLIRDCFSWLDSRVEHVVRQPWTSRHPAWQAERLARYERHDDRFAPEEAVLREAGLRPIAAYLRAWSDYNERVLTSVPADRLLVLRTEDLDRSVDALVRFTGVPASAIQPRHANRRPSRTGLVEHVPAAFVVEQARAQCAPHMERFWGADWCDLRSRLPDHPSNHPVR
jgi:hypothetical protein